MSEPETDAQPSFDELVYAVRELERRVALLENPPQQDPLEEGAAVLRHQFRTKKALKRGA